VANLSVRTIQRIENGAEPSGETLRVLAEAFGIPDMPFLNTGVRRDYPAPWSTELKAISAGMTILLIAVAVILDNFLSAFPLLILFGSLMYSVHGYSLRGGKLLIHRLGWATKYELSELEECHVIPNAMMGSMRVFGNGGLFGYTGLFRNAILGRYRAFATRRKNCLILKFGDTTVALTPDEPVEMQQAIEELSRGPGRPDQG
jgi:hypothetical protein